MLDYLYMTLENKDIRFFVIDDTWGKRDDMQKLISKIAPEAELEMFEHPVYLKRWLELQRQAGVDMAQKPTFVITDHQMTDVQEPYPYEKGREKYQIRDRDTMDALKKQWQDYQNIEGSLKVLKEFVDYLGDIFVIGFSGGFEKDQVVEKQKSGIPEDSNQMSNFGHDTTSTKKIQFTEDKLRAELDKFRALLHTA